MNKYSSKAIKTAATVGMSLAMVLSAAAPVMPVMAASIEDVVEQKDKVEDLLDLLGDAKNIAADDIVGGSGAQVTGVATANDITFAEILEDADTLAMLQDAYKYASVAGYTTEQKDILEYLVGTKIGGYVRTAVEHAEELLSATTTDALDAYSRKAKIDSTDVAAYNVIKDLMDFKGNIPSDATSTDALEKIEETFADMQADVEDYKEDNVTSDAKKFAKKLAEEKVSGKTVAELVDDEVEISYTNLSSLNAFITKVTKDSYKLDDVKYGDVKDEDVVADYIEGLKTIADEMQEVKDLINDTKSEKKAFDKLKTKIASLTDVAKTDADDDGLDEIDDAIAEFRSSDVKTLKEYVDAFVNEFWTVTTEQRTSGSYRVKEVNAGLGRYYTFEDAAGKNLKALMTTLVDSDEEDTFYDLLVADAASTDELLKAVTTDIEGITMSTNLTDKQAAKIVAAKKALAKLDAEEKKIYNTLKRSEKADVDANRDLIDALYVKMILNGNITESGWVDKGNGDWDYIAEDGSRPSKWVASGANWYYVKNGTMLRNSWIASDAQGTRWYYVDGNGVMVSNTTINGYTFNSYGVWVK